MHKNHELTFDNLPAAVSKILTDITEIRTFILQTNIRKPITNDILSTDKTLTYLASRGYQISKSKLYKLTSTQNIPYGKLNNKLIFYKKELSHWLDTQIVKNPNTLSESQYSVILSAQKKHSHGKR